MKQEPINIAIKKSDQGELIKHEARKYLRYWVWFAIGVGLCLLLAFLYLRYTPKVYRSNAKIQILNKAKGIELPSSAFIFNRSSINLENEIEILKSYRIMEQVVKNLDLTMEFYEEGNVLTSEIDRFPFSILKTVSNDSIFRAESFRINIKESSFEIFRGSSDKPIEFKQYSSLGVNHGLPFEIQYKSLNSIKTNVGKTYILKFIPVAAATGKLKSRVSVSMLGKNSDLLQLGLVSESKPRAERVLNQLVEVFNQDGILDRQEVSKRTIEFIDERFIYLAEELDSIEGEKRDFKQSNNLVYIEADAELGLDQRTQSENQVFKVENQLLLTEMLKESINVEDKESELLPANIGIENSNVNTLIDEYNTLVFERDRYLSSGGEKNPSVQLLNTKLREILGNIKASLTSYKLQLEASQNQLVDRNRKFASQVSSFPGKEKIMRSIDRQQAIKESLYLFLLQKREEAAINLAITEPSIKVVENALSVNVPVSPNPKNIYLFALVAGFLIPFGVLYATILLDTKIKGKTDIEERVPNVPILAELPKIKGNDLVFYDPTDRSVQAEAFRILSSNVNYMLNSTKSDKGKVVYCTSTIKGEGKTYAGTNLSLAISSLNKKVLLIGADLRNPQIHHYTTPERDKNDPGLSNYLYDNTFDWKKALVKGFAMHPDHDILLSGSIPPNPAHLLTNGRFENLLNEAKEIYDYIIVDTAPTILVTDTLLISQWADVTLYLVRAEVTEKNLLDFSKNLNDTKRLKNMAYVINSVGASKSYGYSYNYGYGYGYGSTE
ncbi:polysaccharide biosynthesis tyrosine autokinase [uncultured Psychroserpens sp.]|uniref:GumC family protein n=1 Tax=uncultured Psychroserpens sp. TaxID=255436 RepID=UPI002606F938|nr:polysaccharide biosynthesis tyrosine autokinase [uncultured Psychroserpens sp.]